MRIREATCFFHDVNKYSRWYGIGKLELCKNLCRKQYRIKFGIGIGESAFSYAIVSILKNESGIGIGESAFSYAIVSNLKNESGIGIGENAFPYAIVSNLKNESGIGIGENAFPYATPAF